ncbi:histidine kinase dimerization/phospho-acceptor domain-containing protein [Paenibacillus sp. D51F]
MLAFRQPILVLLLFSIFISVMSLVSNSHDDAADLPVSEWSIAWIQKPNPSGPNPPADLSWHSATAQRPLTALPDGAVGAWIRVPIPPTAAFNDPGLYIRKLYGLDVTVYEDARAIYHSSRNYDFERNILLVPLTSKSAASEIYIVMESKEGAGISSEIRVGEFADLSSSNARKQLPNVLLGAAIAFLGFIMLLSTGFFVRSLTKPANALSLFILSTGLLIVTNSSLPYFYFPDYGPMLFFLFDTFLLILFPSLFYFVCHSFELTNGWLKMSQSWLIGYSGASFLVMLVYKAAGGSFYFYYKLFTFWILAPLVLAQLVVILIVAIRNLFRKSRSSMLLSMGIIGLVISGVADFIVLSYRQSPYEFELWKFGIVFLVACLVMALNRRIAGDYAKLLAYSNELELYNLQLQKSERMQIISQLAASIAHEVRNPLQVTRGFLQLLSRKSTEANKYQYDIAISELDRAAGIITDYLTFAKPEQETPAAIDVKQVEHHRNHFAAHGDDA